MEKKLNAFCNILSAIFIVLLIFFVVRSATRDDVPTNTSANIPSEITSIERKLYEIDEIITKLDDMRKGIGYLEDMLYELENIPHLSSDAKDLIDDIDSVYYRYCEGVPEPLSQDLYDIKEDILNELFYLKEKLSS